jgi:flavorubredoxin
MAESRTCAKEKTVTITNAQSGTNIEEIADGIYRISTPIPPEAVPVPGGFTFNQILIVDKEPLLFHTGMRSLFPLVREAVEHVMPPEKLRLIAFSHLEADESGSMNQWLALATGAEVLCSQTAAMLHADSFDRPCVPLADGAERTLGRHVVRWFDAPHVPHGWDCGFIGERTTRTLLCGDLFTQPGAKGPALTDGDILGPSEAMRTAMDYFAHGPGTAPALARLAAFGPETLACMHGSSFRGDGGALIGELARTLSPAPGR